MMTKASQIKYFILDPDAVSPVAATKLYNTTTTQPILNVGAAGFYMPALNSGNHTEATGAIAPFPTAMKLILRRNTNNDRSPLYNRPWEESDWINAFCLNGFSIESLTAEAGTNSSHLIGYDPAVAANLLVPQDEFTYQIQVSEHGDKTDWFNSSYNTPTTFGFYTTPDFSATAYTTAQQRDIIFQELALDFNNKSRYNSYVICLQDGAPAPLNGAIAVATLASLASVGTTITIGYDKAGNPHQVKLNLEMVQAFDALNTVDGNLYMVPYLTPGTSNAPAGVNVAGTVNVCTMLYAMALDQSQAYYDYRMQTKTRIEVGLVSGFDNVPQQKVTDAYEGQGYPHQLKVAYQATNLYEETHRATLPHNQNHVQFPNFLKEDAWYDYIVINHCDTRSATSGMPNYNNATTIIALVNTTVGDITVNPYFGHANAILQRTYVTTVLNEFIANNNLNIPTL
jgi:hypothetical protein